MEKRPELREKQSEVTMRAKPGRGIRVYSVSIMAIFLCAGSVSGQPTAGAAARRPIRTRFGTAEQLDGLGLNTVRLNDKCYILMADLDLTGKTFNQAVIAMDTDSSQSGFQGVGFSGVFDGAGHVLRNLTIQANKVNTSYLGLFGLIEAAGNVRNLSLDTLKIQGGGQSDFLGGIGGYSRGKSQNCGVQGTVQGSLLVYGGTADCSWIGGIAGKSDGGTLLDCEASGTAMGCYAIGGLVGENSGTLKPLPNQLQRGGLGLYRGFNRKESSCRC